MSTFNTIVEVARKETAFSVGQFFWPLRVLVSFFRHSVSRHSVKWARYFAGRRAPHAATKDLDAQLEELRAFNAAMRHAVDVKLRKLSEVTSALNASLDLSRQLSEEFQLAWLSEEFQLAWSIFNRERERKAEDLKPLLEEIAYSEALERMKEMMTFNATLGARAQEMFRLDRQSLLLPLIAAMMQREKGLIRPSEKTDWLGTRPIYRAIITDITDMDSVLSRTLFSKPEHEALARITANYLKAYEEIIRKRKE